MYPNSRRNAFAPTAGSYYPSALELSLLLSNQGKPGIGMPDTVLPAGIPGLPDGLGGGMFGGLFKDLGGLEGIGSLMSGLGSLGGLYTGMKQLGLADKQLGMQKQAYEENLRAQKASFNEANEYKQRMRGSYGGKSQDEINAAIAKYAI